MVAGDLYAILTALVSPPGRLDDVCCHGISCIPSGFFKEISLVRVRLASTVLVNMSWA
jgi:hypothetical protein